MVSAAITIVVITDNKRLADIFQQVCGTLAYGCLHLTSHTSTDTLLKNPNLVIADAVNTQGAHLSQILSKFPSYVRVLWLMPENTQTDSVQHVLCNPFSVAEAIHAIQVAVRLQPPSTKLPENLLYEMLTATSPDGLFYTISQYLMNHLSAQNMAILRIADDMSMQWLYWYHKEQESVQAEIIDALLERKDLPLNWYRFPFLTNDLQGVLLIEMHSGIEGRKYNLIMEIGKLAARVWQRETALASSREYIQSLQAFEMMGRSIVGELELQTAIESAARSIRALLNCSVGLVWLLKKEKLSLAACAGIPAPIIRELSLDLPFAQTVIQEKGIFSDKQFDHTHEIFGVQDTYHTLIVPLVARDQVIGMLQAINISKTTSFSTMDEWRLRNLASWCVIAISNADLHQRVHTALKRERAYRDRIIQAEKLTQVGQLVATVAHEVNNPLQIINAGVSFLQHANDDPDTLENLGIIEEAALQIEQVVWRIRESYEVPERDVSYFDLNDMLERVSQMFVHQLEMTKTVIELYLDADLPIFAGFEHEIREVIINLVKNAIEAIETHPNGTIWLSSAYDVSTKTIVLAVQDNGIGIPEEVQEVIFDMFFTTKSNGSGIGLAISQDIVVQHGGRIEVESNPGGTTFYIKLPVK